MTTKLKPLPPPFEFNMARVVRAAEAAAEKERQRDADKAVKVPTSVLGYQFYSITDTTLATYPAVVAESRVVGRVDIPGEQLYFLREGSNPGTRVDVDFGNGVVFERVKPGDVIRYPFSGATFLSNRHGAFRGRARFLIAPSKDFSYAEREEPGSFVYPVGLNPLGGFAAGALVMNTAKPNNDPLLEATKIDVTGWTRFELTCFYATTLLTSGRLALWETYSDENRWVELPNEGISIPTTDNTAFATDMIRLYFELPRRGFLSAIDSDQAYPAAPEQRRRYLAFGLFDRAPAGGDLSFMLYGLE
jgi:hypothetical protein